MSLRTSMLPNFGGGLQPPTAGQPRYGRSGGVAAVAGRAGRALGRLRRAAAAMMPDLNQYRYIHTYLTPGRRSARTAPVLGPLRCRAAQLLGTLAATGLVTDSSQAQQAAWSQRPVFELGMSFAT